MQLAQIGGEQHPSAHFCDYLYPLYFWDASTCKTECSSMQLAQIGGEQHPCAYFVIISTLCISEMQVHVLIDWLNGA